MPAADARLTNTNFPTPETFQNYSVSDLLTAAGYGRIGVDKRLVQAILARGEAAVPEVVRFADEPFPEEDTANLTRALFLLLRHYRTPDAIPFLLALLKANIEELPEELMEAVLEIGAPAVEPVLKLYDDIDEDELRGELAFLLASFRNRDERILERLLDHFEFDAADGAIILESFGDPAAIPSIEKVLAEPGLDAEVQKHLTGAVERIREAAAAGVEETPAAPPFDVLEGFADTAGPVIDILKEYEMLALLGSPSEEYREAAADGVTSSEVRGKIETRLREMAHADTSAKLRGRAWEALARDPDDKELIAELTAVLEDASKEPPERCGALVALASLDKYSKLRQVLPEFHQAFPEERARVIKAMWRSSDRTWEKYVVEALSSGDENVREQAILGIGYLFISSEADKLEALFDDERFRAAALYSYALAAPGETSRVRMKTLFNKIDKLAGGMEEGETELVHAALDERLAARGLKPVFHVPGGAGGAAHDHQHDHDHDHVHEPASKPLQQKVGRNDPCPCGSGLKYKKCHGK